MARPGALLGPDDLEVEVTVAAPRLLGCLLHRRLGDRVLTGRIVEVEAYAGPEDRASHARAGRTARTAPMFGPPGHAYVYLIYGMHHCLNVVTGVEGEAAAVLVRALEPVEGIAARCDGPGRLCKALGIDRGLDGRPLRPEEGLWIEEPGATDRPVETSARIGVGYAEEPWASRRWRFYLADSGHVSRRRAPRGGA